MMIDARVGDDDNLCDVADFAHNNEHSLKSNIFSLKDFKIQ